MQNIVRLGVIAALGFSGSALAAEGVSHTFVEAGYGYGEIAGGAVDGDGFAVGGSFQLPANFLVAASYSDFDYDGTDIAALSAGAGYVLPLGSAFDLIAGASFEQLEVDSEDVSGFGLNVGTRGRLTDKVELSARLAYVDLDEGYSAFTSTLGARYYVNRNFAWGLDVNKSDLAGMAPETSFTLKLRYDFGQR